MVAGAGSDPRIREGPPSITAEPPSGWITTEVPRPSLGGGSGASLTQWVALGSPDVDGEVFLRGCVATPIPGWVEDMRPSVESRTTSFATSAAERIVGVPVVSRPEGATLAVRPTGTSDLTPRVGVARTYVSWSGHELVTCFAVCARSHTSKRTGARACDAAVGAARLEGGTVAPPPGLTLAVVTWGIHNPFVASLGGALFTLFAAVLAVVSRRRPRSRI